MLMVNFISTLHEKPRIKKIVFFLCFLLVMWILLSLLFVYHDQLGTWFAKIYVQIDYFLKLIYSSIGHIKVLWVIEDHSYLLNSYQVRYHKS